MERGYKATASTQYFSISCLRFRSLCCSDDIPPKGQTDLKDELGNWFAQEIAYLEKKLHLPLISPKGKKENEKQGTPVEKEKPKVLCNLSADQTGLILRAADELRVLKARSMSQVFRTIVPYLSTPYKENLSYVSMRSKSYVAEERDKKTAIEFWERPLRR